MGSYSRSKASVREQVGLSAGGFIGAEIRNNTEEPPKTSLEFEIILTFDSNPSLKNFRPKNKFA